MKYKVGDKVRVKSKEWCNGIADRLPHPLSIDCRYLLDVDFCGKICEITEVFEDTKHYLIGLKGVTASVMEGVIETLVNEENPMINEEVIKDIADVIKKHNLGVSVSEKDGKIIVEPLKEDLPIDTPVICSNSFKAEQAWFFCFYAGNGKTWWDCGSSKNENRKLEWKCIIPFDKFNPNDIEESLKYNIVK